MAIAFVGGADLGNNSGVTNSLTASYTVGAGSNRILWVEFEGDISTGNDDITGVTYGGTTMTLVGKVPGQGGASSRFEYLYTLVNPASGANNVVISCTNTHYILACAADHSGAAQSGQPDATSSQDVIAASVVTTVTTIADNCWTVLGARAPSLAAGSGSTQRAIGAAFGDNGIFDSNGVVHPAGSTSMTVTGLTTQPLETIMASFAPFVSGATTNPYFYRNVGGMAGGM